MRYSCKICFVIYFFYGSHSSAQQINYSFRQIGQADGLLSDHVFGITQDSRGYIWIGTQNGLQRYDGSRFVNYQDGLNNENKSAITVNGLYATRNKQLCLFVNNRLKKMDLVNNRFSNFEEEEILKAPVHASDVYKDENNNSYVLGEDCFYYYDSIAKKKIVQPLFLPYKAARDSVRGETWVANWSGLWLFDTKSKRVYSSKYNGIHHPLLALRGAKTVTIDNEHNIWISLWDPWFYKYNPNTKKLTKYSTHAIRNTEGGTGNIDAALEVDCIFEDNHHHIWIATENAGLLQYNKQQDAFSYSTAKENKAGSIQYNFAIFCIFQDREDNIWLGTDKGISIFNPYRQYYQIISHEPGNDKSLPKKEITELIQIRTGDVLAGTWGGGFTVYDDQLHFKKNIFFPSPSEKNLVWCFLENEDGKVWIGCQHGYLHQYDPLTGNIITLHPAELQGSTVRCMQKDTAGNIWFGLHNGNLSGWNKNQNKFYAYTKTMRGQPSTLYPVHSIFAGDGKVIWAATETGLKLFDTVKKMYTAVYYPGNSRYCLGLEKMNDSILSTGVVNGGIAFFNTKTKTFFPSPINDNIASGTVHAMHRDAVNNVWLTTDNRLYKYKTGENKLINCNIEPGLINASFQLNYFLPLHNGSWLTATSTEIICFHPDSLNKTGDHPLPVEITGFKLFDKTIPVDSLITARKPIQLTYKENFLTIEFAALNFSNINEVKYYYRLSGINKNWVTANTLRSASYTSLEPGHYTFSVLAEDGNNTPLETPLVIIIAPPFWQTWWFRVMSALLLAGMAWWLIRKRIQNIRYKAELKHKIAETEMMALRAQMNPHFIFNCLNAIDNLIQNNQPDKATTYLVRFAKLIRAVLDSSKNNTVSFQKDYSTLELFLQLEQFRYDYSFGYEINTEQELLMGDYKVPPLIVQPFVENSIFHGLLNKQSGDRKLFIQVKLDSDCIKYTIEDNGVGRERARAIKERNKPEYQSYGIPITTERIQLFNQGKRFDDVIITDLAQEGKPSGTRVEVKIRINH
jgi:ligand-binding sensor domain-containing protein